MNYPHLERLILADIILEQALPQDVIPVLNETYFTEATTVHLFLMLKEMYERKETINATAVYEYLNRCQVRFQLSPESIGKIIAVHVEDFDITEAIGKLEYYFNRQRMESLLNDCNKNLQKGDDIGVVHSQLLDGLGQLYKQDRSGYCASKSMTDAMEMAVAGRFKPIPFYFPTLDKQLIGIYKPEVNLVAARTRNGKTTFMIDRSIAWLDHGLSIMWFLLEMTEHQALGKLICNMAQMNSTYWQQGQFNDKDQEHLASAYNRFAQWDGRFWVYDNIYFVPQMAKEIRLRKPDIVCLDYIQLISGSDKRGKKDLIDSSVRHLKRVLKETNTAAVVLSQTNREVEKTVDGIPRINHLSESDGLSHDSATVTFLSWPHANDFKINSEQYWIGVAKNRFGRMGSTENIKFNAECGSFHDILDTNKDQTNIFDAISEDPYIEHRRDE